MLILLLEMDDLMLSWLNSFDDCCPKWAASSWGYERVCDFQHLFISVECLAHGWKDIVLGRMFEVILRDREA